MKRKWEEAREDRAKQKKLENEIYERKKGEYAKISAEKRAEERYNKAEAKAEFRAKGGVGGAIKRGAISGFKTASKGAYSGVKQISKGAYRGTKAIIRNQANAPRRSSGMAYSGNNFNAYDLFGGAPKQSVKRSKPRQRSSNAPIVINIGGATPRHNKPIKKRRSPKRNKKAGNDFFNWI